MNVMATAEGDVAMGKPVARQASRFRRMRFEPGKAGRDLRLDAIDAPAIDLVQRAAHGLGTELHCLFGQPYRDARMPQQARAATAAASGNSSLSGSASRSR